ncbi:MAG: hypothetical protein GX458_18895 [Phyllobacteriaceae bacterium]|nr:hypothetical protein [Phyllobacteriaceae bacterium]
MPTDSTPTPPPSPDAVEPRSGLSVSGAAVFAVLAIFALVLYAVISARHDVADAPPPRSTEAEPVTVARATPIFASPAARRLATLRVEPLDPLAAPTDVEGRWWARLSPPPPYDAIDSTLIDAGYRRYRLVEAVALGRNDVCRRNDGSRFACGLSGRALLQNYLRGKQMVCDPLFVDVDRRRDFVSARCRVDGRDLATLVIEAGLARPSPLAGAAHVAAMERARRDERGIWSGPAPDPDTDPALIDDAAVGFGSMRLSPPDLAPPDPPQP